MSLGNDQCPQCTDHSQRGLEHATGRPTNERSSCKTDPTPVQLDVFIPEHGTKTFTVLQGSTGLTAGRYMAICLGFDPKEHDTQRGTHQRMTFEVPTTECLTCDRDCEDSRKVSELTRISDEKLGLATYLWDDRSLSEIAQLRDQLEDVLSTSWLVLQDFSSFLREEV